MRTTLNLDEALFKELLEVTGAKTKTAAIHQAVSEMIRRKKIERLKSLSGKIRFDLDWKDLERIEVKEQEKRMRQRRGHR